MSRAERLAAYLDALGPLVWGESDCCVFAAKWVEAERGVRIAYPNYNSMQQANGLIAAAGGLVSLVAPLLQPLFARTVSPQLGDVGVVRLSTGDVGAIFVEYGIAALRSESGAIFMHPKTIVAAWAV